MDWDARYRAADGPLFGARPNAWLRSCLARRAVRPRSALAIADGDGRNGLWLARRGLAVMAVDVSAEATRRALARDVSAGVTVARRVGDVASWTPPDGARFDLAALIYLQGPTPQRAAALRLATGCLAPGGWLVLECFATGAEGGPGPGEEKRYAPEEVAAALRGFEIEALVSGLVRLDEGPRHCGLATVVRALARRPG